MTAPLIDVDFETWFSEEIQCDGVVALNIPPHEAPAEWVLAHDHGCPKKARSAKCDFHYRMFEKHLKRCLEAWAAIECSYCGAVFYTVAEFVEYRRI